MTEVEGKEGDGDSFLIDTSECSASESEMMGADFSGSEKSEKSPSKKEDKTDPFLKIKMHALLGMQTLFKVCSKAFTLHGLWHPIFPHFLTKPRPEIAQFL
jgi:hypothetical protein